MNLCKRKQNWPVHYRWAAPGIGQFATKSSCSQLVIDRLIKKELMGMNEKI